MATMPTHSKGVRNHITQSVRIPICKIKYRINEILLQAAKKRLLKRKKNGMKDENCFTKKNQNVKVESTKQRHWNMNILIGRMTRSVKKQLETRYTFRWLYKCMPLLGDEHLLEPAWLIHAASVIIEYADSFEFKHPHEVKQHG